MVAWLVGLINHHFVLKLSKIDISENFKFFCAPPSLKGNWLLSHKVFMRRLSNRRGHFGKDQCFLPQQNRQACWNSPRESSDRAHGRAVGLGGGK
jgi:hypothetical protein